MNERSGFKDATATSEHRVGTTLRRLRKEKGLSLQGLSDCSGVSVGMISQVERGLANPSIRLLTALRRALNASMQELFGEIPAEADEAGGPDPSFVRRVADRPTIDLGNITKALLTPSDRHNLQIMILKIEPGGESGGRALSYPAEKGGLVLAGEITLQVDEETTTLRSGDSAVFDSARPHSLRNLGDETAELLWIIGAVQFDRHL